MNLAGYLVLLANLQHISKLTKPLQDLSFHVNTLSVLIEMLHSLDFPIEGFSRNGLQSRGNLSVYASQNLRDFIFKGEGTADDEGIILKLHYGPSVDRSDGGAEKYDALSYFVHGHDVDDAVKKAVIKKMKLLERSRSKRSILNRLIP